MQNMQLVSTQQQQQPFNDPELVLATLEYETAISGIILLQTSIVGITEDVRHIISHVGRTLTEQASQITILEERNVVNERLRQEEKRTADQKIEALQDQLSSLIRIVNQLSGKVTKEESARIAEFNSLSNNYNGLSKKIAEEKANQEKQNIVLQQKLASIENHHSIMKESINQEKISLEQKLKGINVSITNVKNHVDTTVSAAKDYTDARVNPVKSDLTTYANAFSSTLTAVNLKVEQLKDRYNGHTHGFGVHTTSGPSNRE